MTREANPPASHTAKVIHKACTWNEKRKEKIAAPEGQKASAQSAFKRAGDELSEAVEKLQKSGEKP